MFLLLERVGEEGVVLGLVSEAAAARESPVERRERRRKAEENSLNDLEGWGGGESDDADAGMTRVDGVVGMREV
jgi:hypothetical protein